MPNRVGSFGDGAAKDAHGKALWQQTKAGIASKVGVNTNINGDNLARAKREGWPTPNGRQSPRS